MNKKEELLKQKYGKIRGGQSKLAGDLGTEQGTVQRWFADGRKPGPDYILKLAKIFKKSESEIKAIFEVKGKHYQASGGGNADLSFIKTEFELQKKEIALIKSEIQAVSLKLDLILEKLKSKK